MIEAEAISSAQEKALLAEWFETVHWDKDSPGLPALDADPGDDPDEVRTLWIDVHVSELEENGLADFLAKRVNPNHDKAGKFASGHGGSALPTHTLKPGGLTAEQHADITPGKGQTKAKALKSLNATPEGRTLVATTDEWQNNMSAVTRLQGNFMKRSQGKKLTKAEDAKVTSLMNGIRNSEVSPPLYRGIRLPNGSDPIEMHKPGSSFIIPPSSFTSSSRMGRGFAKAPTGARKPPVAVVYRVKNGGRALPIEVYGASTYKNEKEHISAGQFKVTGVTKGSDGVFTVDVEHVAMFEW